MISGLLEVIDRAVHISARGGALGVAAVQVDDLAGGSSSRARERKTRRRGAGSDGLRPRPRAPRGRLLERGEKLARAPPAVTETSSSMRSSNDQRRIVF